MFLFGMCVKGFVNDNLKTLLSKFAIKCFKCGGHHVFVLFKICLWFNKFSTESGSFSTFLRVDIKSAHITPTWSCILLK